VIEPHQHLDPFDRPIAKVRYGAGSQHHERTNRKDRHGD